MDRWIQRNYGVLLNYRCSKLGGIMRSNMDMPKPAMAAETIWLRELLRRWQGFRGRGEWGRQQDCSVENPCQAVHSWRASPVKILWMHSRRGGSSSSSSVPITPPHPQQRAFNTFLKGEHEPAAPMWLLATSRMILLLSFFFYQVKCTAWIYWLIEKGD